MFEDFFSELCDEGFTFTETQKTIMREVFLENVTSALDSAHITGHEDGYSDGYSEGYNEGFYVGREEND